MARNILLNHNLTTPPDHVVGIAAFGSLLLVAFALFMCATTHTRKWRKWQPACYGYDGNNDDGPVIQLNPAQGMIHEAAFQVFGDNVDDESTAVPYSTGGEGIMLWKKNIMMGGKCQLPDFSGVIIYDTQGNIVPSAADTLPLPPPPPRALPWK